MITHQTPEQILQAATPEQKILWNYIFLRWGERVAISQFIYEGTVAGMGELGVYSANKLYYAYEFDASEAQGVVMAGVSSIYFYDENNANFKIYAPTAIGFDVTAAAWRFYPTNYKDTNFYFSRITVGQFDFIKFIGYRLGI